MTADNVSRPSVLVIEDDAEFARLVRVLIDVEGRGRYRLEHVGSMGEAESRQAAPPDVVLLDLTLPDCPRTESVARAQRMAPRAALVVVTGHDDDTSALQAVGAGAQDYLIKGGLNGSTLLRSVQYAMVRKRLELERVELIGKLGEALGRVATLEGLLPICSKCRRIRNDTGDWEPMERYVESRTRAQFTHGLCDPCAHELYGDLADALPAGPRHSHG